MLLVAHGRVTHRGPSMNRKQRRANQKAAPPQQQLAQMYREAFLHQQAGRPAAAETVYRRILAAAPRQAEALCNLGMALASQSRLDEAVSVWRQAIAVTPDLAEAQLNLGAALRQLCRWDEAVAAYQRAIALRPDDADVYNSLGLAEVGRTRLEEAMAAWRRAVALRPDHAEAHSNLSCALLGQGRLDEAVAACGRAIALKPDHAEAHSNLGCALLGQGRLDEAAAACRRAIAMKPDHAEAHTILGAALTEQGRLHEAAAACRTAIALKPHHMEAHKNLGAILVKLGRLAEGMGSIQTAIDLRPDDPNLFRNLLSCAVYRDDFDSEDNRQLHLRFGAAFAAPFKPLPLGDLSTKRPLRIGYLSSDFRSHPVAGNFLPVVRNHDRRNFRLFFYAHVMRPDAVTAEFRALAEGWRNIVGLGDREVAELVRADDIDILVSLAGRLDENRPTVCCWRAAPVQISMHDVATSGLAEMDYIVGDPWLLPRRTTEYFSERPLRLPSFYIAARPAAPPGSAFVRQPGAPVYGCFNSPAKITPSVLALWGRILAATPGATLVLKYLEVYKSEETRTHFLDILTAAGADADQVRFVTDAVSEAEFLGLHDGIDVALDTFPFSGSTTTFQALRMGVPVVTWPWDRMVSRWTASMLHALGLDDLIAASADDYVRIAVAAGADANAWHRRRQEIRDRIAGSALCDPTRWAGNLERLYRAVWGRHCRAAQDAGTAR